VSVSMRVMSAGDWYKYLLRTVAAADGDRSLSTPLTRYYAEAGTPPGRWLGSGLAFLDRGEIAGGALVSETRETLLPGGWLRTGDIVRVDESGFVTIVDRLKELVIVGGFNVAPSEVEATIVSHPSVVDAAVVGLLTASGGESVAAAVVLAPGATLDVSELRAHVRSRLAAYKVPKNIVAVDDLPRSLIGKVLRREVRTLLLAQPGD